MTHAKEQFVCKLPVLKDGVDFQSICAVVSIFPMRWRWEFPVTISQQNWPAATVGVVGRNASALQRSFQES